LFALARRHRRSGGSRGSRNEHCEGAEYISWPAAAGCVSSWLGTLLAQFNDFVPHCRPCSTQTCTGWCSHWQVLSPVQVLDPEQVHVYRDMTLGQYLDSNGYSEGFKYNYVLPMCAAVWSVPNATVSSSLQQSVTALQPQQTQHVGWALPQQ
jgi:hypothetical protein